MVSGWSPVFSRCPSCCRRAVAKIGIRCRSMPGGPMVKERDRKIPARRYLPMSSLPIRPSYPRRWGQAAGGAPGIQQIRQRGTLIVAMYYEDRPPYFYVDDAGRLVGSDVEMALDIAAKLGVDVAFLRTARSFDEVIAQVARGEADVGISKLSATLARAEHVLFTEPYLVLHQALLVNRLQFARLKLNEDEMLAELQNTRVKIGVKAKTSYEGYVREMFPQAEVVRIGEEDDVMAAAARGDVLAAFYDELEVKRFIYDNPSMAIDLKVLVLEDRPDPLAMAVAPENIQLLGWLNLYLRLYQQELSVDSLLRHYGPVGVRP